MNTLALRHYKASLHMTERQRQILYGMLLGDGHLERQHGAQSARLKIEHSVAQKDYVAWKFAEWRDWVRTPPRASTKESTRNSLDECWVLNPVAHRVRGSSSKVLCESPQGGSKGSRAHSAGYGRVVHGRWFEKIETVSRRLPQHSKFHHFGRRN